VGSVANMGRMFYKASSFNSDVSAWNVSRVENMEGMFENASSFDQTLCWDIDECEGADSSYDDDDCVSTASMFTGSSGSISSTCAPIPVPTTSPAPAPTAAKASDDGPDDGTLQEIGDAVVDYWSATKNLFKVIWGAVF
jgi:surface protein